MDWQSSIRHRTLVRLSDALDETVRNRVYNRVRYKIRVRTFDQTRTFQNLVLEALRREVRPSWHSYKGPARGTKP